MSFPRRREARLWGCVAIVTLGKGLHLNVIAEGVETLEQVEQLRSLQCEEMQGHWFSRPLTAQAATQLYECGGVFRTV